MENNYIDENKVENKTKCSAGAKIVFYIFGVFCVLLSLGSLLVIFTTLFGYDKEVAGTITEISYNRVLDEYDIVIEYSIDGKPKTQTVHSDKMPLGIRANDEVKVKYSSKNKTTYIPKFESILEQLTAFLITSTVATVCFIAPNNSKEAANKFLSLRGKVRKL